MQPLGGITLSDIINYKYGEIWRQTQHTHPAPLAFDYIASESPRAVFLYLIYSLHIGAHIAHGLDHLVERDKVLAISAQHHARSINRLDGGHGLAFDAEDLYQLQRPDRT